MTTRSLDSLYGQVARKILTESLAIKKGESVTVECWDTGLPFAKHVAMEARKMGAIPLTIFENEDAYVEGVKAMPKDVLGQMGKHEFGLLSGTDAYVFIPGPVLGAYSHRLPRADYLDSVRYNDSWYKAAAKARLRGVRLTFGYLSEDAVPVLGKPLRSLVEHQLRAALADYGPIRKKAREIADLLKEGAKASVATAGSTLQFEVKGGVEVQDGIIDAQDIAEESNVAYIPPGHVYANIVPESVSGSFVFSPSVTRFGIVSGQAQFREGKFVDASSKETRTTLKKMVDSVTPNARVASAITIGLNPLMKYGYGQNANSAGVVGVRILGANLTARSPSMKVSGKTVIGRGRF